MKGLTGKRGEVQDLAGFQLVLSENLDPRVSGEVQDLAGSRLAPAYRDSLHWVTCAC